MYAEVDLLLPSEEKALFVPEGAVFEVEGKQVVFIPAGTRAFSAQEISARRRPGGFMEIVKGLKEGDRYVTEGGFLLKSELQKKSLEVD
jgi:multidrug efflux pump subunit AcrA (membrane-fusion protein)